LKIRKKIPVFLGGSNLPESLPTHLPVLNITLRYLGGPLNVVGIQYPTTFGNVNLYRLLVPVCQICLIKVIYRHY